MFSGDVEHLDCQYRVHCVAWDYQLSSSLAVSSFHLWLPSLLRFLAESVSSFPVLAVLHVVFASSVAGAWRLPLKVLLSALQERVSKTTPWESCFVSVYLLRSDGELLHFFVWTWRNQGLQRPARPQGLWVGNVPISGEARDHQPRGICPLEGSPLAEAGLHQENLLTVTSGCHGQAPFDHLQWWSRIWNTQNHSSLLIRPFKKTIT